MILTDSISISQSAENVFDMVTNPARVHEWDDITQRVEILSQGAWGGYAQARWVARLGKHNLEMVETVLKFDRPSQFSSKIYYTRFTNRETSNASSETLTTNVFERSPKAEFESFLGKGKPYALLQTDFIPTGNNTMTLKLTIDLHVGGYSRFSTWCAKILHLKPLRKKLKSIKAGAEKISVIQNG